MQQRGEGSAVFYGPNKHTETQKKIQIISLGLEDKSRSCEIKVAYIFYDFNTKSKENKCVLSVFFFFWFVQEVGC